MFCRLFVVALAPTLYMHSLALCLIFLTGNDATAWRCHVFNRHVLKWGGIPYLLLLIYLASYFLTLSLLPDHPHLPSSQHFCPHTFRDVRKGFCIFLLNILSHSVTFSSASFSLCFSLFTPSLHLFGLISTATCTMPVPAWAVLLWGHVFERQQDCNAFDSVPCDGGLSAAGDSRLNYHFS